MKSSYLAALILLPLLNALSAQAEPPSGGPSDEWQLTWSDEFNNAGLPDPAKWDYEVGFIRNKESQCYTKDRLENARVENGMLVIEARKEPFKNPNFDPSSRDWRKHELADYTSASLITLGKASWTHCKIEVRAKLPGGAGTWPAIWMMGINRSEVQWPRCGEIDIMESVGKSPRRASANLHFPQPKKGYTGAVTLAKPFNEDFHVFAMERRDDRIDFFMDGKKYHSFSVDEAGTGPENPFRKPHYLILNLAMGGIAGGKIDDAGLPQQFLIDYVRVYTLKGEKSPQ